MNMQALMKQAQAMQKDITNIKNEIDSAAKDLVSDDMSMLEDMVVLALNDAFSKVDKATSEKMGKYSNMMSGLM